MSFFLDFFVGRTDRTDEDKMDGGFGAWFWWMEFVGLLGKRWEDCGRGEDSHKTEKNWGLGEDLEGRKGFFFSPFLICFALLCNNFLCTITTLHAPLPPIPLSHKKKTSLISIPTNNQP